MGTLSLGRAGCRKWCSGSVSTSFDVITHGKVPGFYFTLSLLPAVLRCAERYNPLCLRVTGPPFCSHVEPGVLNQCSWNFRDPREMCHCTESQLPVDSFMVILLGRPIRNYLTPRLRNIA